MEDILKKMTDSVRQKLGDHCIGTIDRSAKEGQFAFATDEVDKGDHVPGDWADIIQKTLRGLGMEHTPVMPFPVHGKIIYVVSGLRRYARSRDVKKGEA